MKVAAILVFLAAQANCQSLTVRSEFYPFEQTFELAPPPREIISPAVPRNGFTTFRVWVTAPAGSSFFLFCETNPPGFAVARLYKILPGDALELVRTPNFGVIPDGATIRAYLLDVWVSPDAEPGRRVRLELQLKMGDWIVYPMELRVQKASVPSVTDPVKIPTSLQEVTVRNQVQDGAFETMLQLPEVWLLTAQRMVDHWTLHSPLSTACNPEWYLKARDLLYRRANQL